MILEREISYIKNDSLRVAVYKTIEHFQEAVRDFPASTSGKYHPPEERGPGGFALHLARIVSLIPNRLEKHFGLTIEETDLLIASALLHDIGRLTISKRNKYGRWVEDKIKFNEWHGELSWTTAWPFLESEGFKLDDSLMLQLKAMIESHMGTWMEHAKLPTRKLEILLSALDYIDTRPWVHIEVEKSK